MTDLAQGRRRGTNGDSIDGKKGRKDFCDTETNLQF